MQSCPSQQTLEQFLAADLSDEASAVFEEHLAGCPLCQSSLHSLSADPAESAWQRMRVSDSGEAAQADTWLVDGHCDRVQESLAQRSSENDTREDVREKTMPSLPGYEMQKLLAQGGMAVVYQARQLRPNRLVAIKFISAGSPGQQRPTNRLIAEADALARLHHPNIVEIFEVGQHEDKPYLVLEYLEGGTLEDTVRGKPLPFLRVAALVETVALAMEDAHHASFVHRDLKPSNILLTSAGTPKIADFGLVKHLRSEDGLTTAGAVLGTPSYMAPEQAGGHSGEISPATDVYALGAILYALITGRPPFQTSSPMETILQVLHEDPSAPVLLRRDLPRDLQTICLHCLEKDPKRRYASAAALAADLRHFQNGEPITVRPLGAVGRTAKWARRRPAVASLLAALLLLFAGGLTLTTWLWERAESRAVQEHAAKEDARTSESREKTARRDVERLSAGLTIDQGQNLCESGNVGAGLTTFVRALEISQHAEDADVERLARLELASWQRHFVNLLHTCQHPSWVTDALFSPDEKTLVTVCYDKKVRRWETATGRLIGEPWEHAHQARCAVFSPDGTQILTGSGPDDNRSGELRAYDAVTGKILHTVAFPSTLRSIRFSPNGTTFLTVCAHQAQLWNLDFEPALPPFRHPNAEVFCGTFSPNGQTVATGGRDGAVRLWDTGTGKSIGQPLHHGKNIIAIAYHPGGKLLATASENNSVVHIWDPLTGRAVGMTLEPSGHVKVLAYSPDGRRLATGAMLFALDPSTRKPVAIGGELRLWDGNTGMPLGAPLLHPMPVWSLAFDPTGERVITGCEDGIARVFSCVYGKPIGNSLFCGGTVMKVAFAQNGQIALTATGGSTARIWNLTPTLELGRSLMDDRAANCMAFSADGKLLALGCENGDARVWDRTEGKFSSNVQHHGSAIRALAWSPKGDRLVTGGEDMRVCLWDIPSGKLVRDIRLGKKIMCISPITSGHGYVVGLADRAFQCDEAGNSVDTKLDSGGLSVMGVIETPDRQCVWLATATAAVRCVNLQTGKVVAEFQHPGVVGHLALSADGKILLTSDKDQPISQLWDIQASAVRGTPLHTKGRELKASAFSPDGRELVIADSEAAQLWDVATGKPIGPRLAEPRGLSATYDPKGKVIVTGGRYGARFWPISEPMPGSLEEVRDIIKALTRVKD